MSNADTTVQKENRILRFPTVYRIEHWVFAISFIVLGITGLIQKYFGWPISVSTISLLGGIDNVRLIHRVSATVMMLAVVYHIGVVGYRLYVRRYRMSLLPGMDDAKNLLGWFLYNLGTRKNRPQEGRYTYGEKVEYWAVVWGTVIMVVTGFMMWNPIATTNFLDGQWIPAAKVAHGGEAVLAILAIIIWHFYNVLVKTFNKSMFTGALTEKQMEHEHPLELADIKAGIHDVKVSQEDKRKRQRMYVPIFSVIGIAMVIGIAWFVTFEQTVITTIPPITTVDVFSPLTPTPLPTLPPTVTPRPTPEIDTASVDWNTAIFPIFEDKCLACHGAAAMGGLNLSTYQGALEGGDTGPGVVPGEPPDSQIVIVQEAGGHPGQLDDGELQTVIVWINAGAPETLEDAGVGQGSSELTYTIIIGPALEAQCGSCHGSTALGGLNLTTYEDTLNGGENGPVIIPGDPDGSLLIEIQEAGGHPGQLDDVTLQQVRDWIVNGADE